MHIINKDAPVNLFDAVKSASNSVDFVTPLKTIEQGKAWIEALTAADLLFHFEDSPETIGNIGTRGEWVSTFTPPQTKLVRNRVADLYALDWSIAGHECPIGYALEVLEKVNG